LTLKVKWSRAPLNATLHSEIYTKYIGKALPARVGMLHLSRTSGKDCAAK
jgi:hypothetical protein